jgi:cytoskeleton protein RodZ
MAGFGENLRHEREMRDISLREISETTKIKIQFLEALEKDKFSDLPGGIYTRSFIRAYANYLGLDADQVLAEYVQTAPPSPEEDYSRIGVAERNSGKRKRMYLVPWFTAALFLGGGYTLFHYTHRSLEVPVSFASPALHPTPAAEPARHPVGSAGNKPAPAAATAATPAPVSAGARSSGGSASHAKTASASASTASSSQTKLLTASNGSTPPVLQEPGSETTTETPQPGEDAGAASKLAGAQLATVSQSGSTNNGVAEEGRLVLKIAATEPCWIEVEADGKTVLESLLSPKEVRTLSAMNSFDITAGNAQGVSLALNGINLKPLGPQGMVKEIRLTRKNLEQINP